MIYTAVAASVLAIALTLYVQRRMAFGAFARRGGRRLTDADLVKVLMGLEPGQLEELFGLYGEQFGPGAARYARRTYLKWKAGEVRPNNRTFRRLLVHLPRVMSFDLKCEVLRRFREEFCPRDEHWLRVRAEDWKESLGPLVASSIEKARTAELPAAVAERLRWLSEGEMQAARAILAESQAREASDALSMLRQEIAAVERLLAEAPGARRVTHRLKLPCAAVTLEIREGRRHGRGARRDSPEEAEFVPADGGRHR